MTRPPAHPFRGLLVEAFSDLDIPVPPAVAPPDDASVDHRDVTRPDRRRPRAMAEDETISDAQLPWALRTSLPPELFLDDEDLPRGEPTRPVDLDALARVFDLAPPSLPVAIGAPTGVYRFNVSGEIEHLEPVAAEPTPPRASTTAPPVVDTARATRPAMPAARAVKSAATRTPDGKRAARATTTKAAAATRVTAVDGARPARARVARTTTTKTSERADKAPRAARERSGPQRRAATPVPVELPPLGDVKDPRAHARGLYREALECLARRERDHALVHVANALRLAPDDGKLRALHDDLVRTATAPVVRGRPLGPT